MSHTSTEVKKRYNKKAYDSMNITVKKGIREKFKSACEKNGKSMNGLINEFIEDYIRKNEQKH